MCPFLNSWESEVIVNIFGRDVPGGGDTLKEQSMEMIKAKKDIEIMFTNEIGKTDQNNLKQCFEIVLLV
jgi:hypothetical protein